MKARKVTTIILDLDGTLIDANLLHRQSFEWAISQVSDFKMTLELEDELEGVSTLNKVIHINETYNKEIPLGKVYDLKQVYTEKNMHTLDMNFELITTLQTISGKYSINLASNARSKFVFSVLNKFKLDMFDIVLTANYIPLELRKPNPFIFNECMRLLNVQPEECLVIEDSTIGITAGIHSGAGKVVRVTSPQHTLEILKKLI
jgi:HAD superfamily hydrolase (TIGR01509 family)|tara:strand:+ start:111 stop:722 length:612 start_codon:yes stop_codon:yes gene_type:complete